MTDYAHSYQLLSKHYGIDRATDALDKAKREGHALVTGTHCHVNWVSAGMYVIVGIEA